MSQKTEQQIAELKEKIRKANIMISYHQKRIKDFKAEKEKLRIELDLLRDDFWDDDG